LGAPSGVLAEVDMLETIIAMGAGLLLWVAYWASAANPESVFVIGVLLVGAGLGFGIPTGLVYHLMLYRSLRRIGALPARWWLHPTALHHAIPPQDRVAVLAWCYAGALGFLVVVAGLPISAAGVWRLG
jgi:hypothetical protein